MAFYETKTPREGQVFLRHETSLSIRERNPLLEVRSVEGRIPCNPTHHERESRSRP